MIPIGLNGVTWHKPGKLNLFFFTGNDGTCLCVKLDAAFKLPTLKISRSKHCYCCFERLAKVCDVWVAFVTLVWLPFLYLKFSLCLDHSVEVCLLHVIYF